MATRISATLAVRSFSDLLDRVQHEGEEFVIERGGRTICRIAPLAPEGRTAGEVARLLRELGAPDAGFAVDLEAATGAQPPIAPLDPWRR